MVYQFIVIVCLFCAIAGSLAAPLAAQDSATSLPEQQATIDRGLAFLSRDAVAWKAEHGCVSCHHAGMVVWAMREAKLRGHAVDEPLLIELTEWMANSGDGKTGVPRPVGIPKALNTKAVYFSLALGVDPAPDTASNAALRRFYKTMEGDQLESGNWAAWPETRPPFFGPSDDSMTTLAVLALHPVAQGGDAATQAARDKGIQWLAQTPTDDDPQSVAMRLVLWKRLNSSDEVWQPLVQRIRDRQQPDGGWAQAPHLPSDAWATGQALYALSTAEFNSQDATIAKGQAFLMKSQLPDGSWPMSSRPTKPGDEGSKSLIPITGGGSAWGVLGLVKSQ